MDSQKSFFKSKNIKIPPTPSFKKRRNMCFDFGYIEDFLKTLKLPDILRRNVRTGFYLDDLSFQDFLDKNPRYKKFIHNLNLFNIRQDYTKLQKILITKYKKTNDLKKLKTIKNRLKKSKNFASLIKNTKFETGSIIPNIPPLNIQNNYPEPKPSTSKSISPSYSQPEFADCNSPSYSPPESPEANSALAYSQNESQAFTPPLVYPQPQSPDPSFVSSQFDDIDSQADTDIINTNFDIPNFQTPPLSPLTSIQPENLTESARCEDLQTPYTTRR